MATIESVYKELKQVFDPEIPVNIVDLGLIYDVKLDDAGACNIRMTLTSQACPEAKTIPDVVRRRVSSIQGVQSATVEIVWEPPWGPHKISAEGRALLGIEDDAALG